MAVSITTRPIYPLPGSVTVAFVATVGDSVRCWVTAAPDGSSYAKDITTAGGPVLAHESDADRAWKFQPDRPGIYQVRIDELAHDVTGYRGGWRGSPSAATSESVVSTQTVPVVVGTALKQQLGWGPTTGTLVLHIYDSTIRRLTTPINGQDSPRLATGSATTLNTVGLQAAIAGLVDETEADTLSDVATMVGDLIDTFNSHIASLGMHPVADASNAVPAAMTTLTSPKSLEQAVKSLQDCLGRHVRDYKAGTTPADTGFGKGGYHNALSTVGLPQAPAPAGSSGLFSTIGDLYVAIVQHLRDDVAHLTAVIPPPSPAVGKLTRVHVEAARAIRQYGATLTQTEHSGLPDLLTTGGFAKL